MAWFVIRRPASSLLSEDEKESVIFSVFSDRFYVAEQGREFLDQDANRKSRKEPFAQCWISQHDGIFQDDVLCACFWNGRKTPLWIVCGMSWIMTRAPMRQHQGLVWFERTDSKFIRDEAFDFARAEDKDVTSSRKYVIAVCILKKPFHLGLMRWQSRPFRSR